MEDKEGVEAMEHTQGPWKSGGGTIYAPWPEREGDRIIADLLTHHGDNGLTNDEVTANAKLIAAAPDLLETLEEIGNGCTDALDRDSDTPFITHIEAIQACVQLAVAKAKP